LEQGIRLMFFDMYKNGTIFEVVFDMPKFLVEHSKAGFSSQDLEEALDIKGTTAKKYIKIMMEIGLIKHERSIGRKHFYKLRKDLVMARLAKDTKVMAS
jgi:predicted transcriptional regulator